MTLAKGLLHRMQIVGAANALNRSHCLTVNLHGQQGTGFDSVAVQMNRARTTLAGVTSDVGAGEINLIS